MIGRTERYQASGPTAAAPFSRGRPVPSEAPFILVRELSRRGVRGKVVGSCAHSATAADLDFVPDVTLENLVRLQQLLALVGLGDCQTHTSSWRHLDRTLPRRFETSLGTLELHKARPPRAEEAAS